MSVVFSRKSDNSRSKKNKTKLPVQELSWIGRSDQAFKAFNTVKISNMSSVPHRQV